MNSPVIYEYYLLSGSHYDIILASGLGIFIIIYNWNIGLDLDGCTVAFSTTT